MPGSKFQGRGEYQAEADSSSAGIAELPGGLGLPENSQHGKNGQYNKQHPHKFAHSLTIYSI